MTLLVITKAPVPGLAKTRLAADIGQDAAADIAAAALLDTLDAVIATPVQARVVALTGDLDHAKRSSELRSTLTAFTVIEQRGDDFADRLANACVDTAAAVGAHPILLIASDTPQVTADLLADSAQRLTQAEAVFGLACDGGWWLFGMADPATSHVLRKVPTSRSDTGVVTLAALRETGIDVRLVTELADVDTVDDMEAVRQVCAADSRFARTAGC